MRKTGLAAGVTLVCAALVVGAAEPRLTGSPNLEAPGRWAVGQMEDWRLTNGRLEPFDFGHAGWWNERLSVHLVAPATDALVTEALAWTPGTDGPVRAVSGGGPRWDRTSDHLIKSSLLTGAYGCEFVRLDAP